MKTKATLKQIAKELGVSVSTVSKALNDSPEISELTKIRIKEYAKLKNYKPNINGLNLKNRKTKTIGVIIPNILNSFFAKVFSGIEKVADKKGYNVITCISNESLEKEIHTMEMLSNGTIDGFILSVCEEAQKLEEYDHFNEIIKDGTPIVMFDRTTDKVVCNKVVINDFDASKNATQHLIDLGCSKIALFSSINNLSVGRFRYEGFLEALKVNNMVEDELINVIAETEFDFDLKVKTVFDSQKIDGIFAVDEHSSVMAMKICLKNGYKIPEDLCIIGFADGVWSRRMTPSLTTVSQHGPEIGKMAANLLIEQLENSKEDWVAKTVIIDAELRQRDSTRKIV